MTALTIGAFATLTLLTKNSFLDEIKKQYVMTARAKGLTERRVLYGHVFRNAMLIVIAGFPAVFIGVFFGGSLIIETIFSLDGLGRLALRERAPARLSGGVRHALRLRPDRADRRAAVGPDLCLGRSAHRLREPRDVIRLNPLQRRRLANFRANRRAFWSLWIFLALFVVTLCAEFVANDRPLVVRFEGEWRFPIFQFYSEADFGGEFQTEAEYASPEVRCLIATGGLEACLDDPEGVLAQAPTGAVDGAPIENPGWALWPSIPYSFNTINYGVATAPSPPDARTGSAPTTRPATWWRG